MYVTSHLINHVASLPPEGNLGALSYYIPESNICLLHTGAKDVLRITEDEIDIVTNGWHGIIFPWTENATFTPNITDSQQQQHNTQSISTNYKSKWADYLFEGALDNISADCMTAKQAIALLQAWVLTIILRNAIIARPILAVFGQQGSGKSTLFRRVMILLYGPKRQVSGITSAEDFDTQMASDPLLVVDNVDTWEKWLPDRIARAAALSETKKRKLYTDVDTVTVRSQALLGISAHNPKFGREDVTDRLILITLERVDFFKPESEMIARISGMRDELWTMIAYDIQRVLREPKPERIPQLRVEDFAALGQRVSNALGCSQDFYDAVESLVRHQKGFTLEEDSMLVDIIARFIKSPRRKSQDFMTPAKLWAEWDQMSGGGMTDRSFQKQYGNSIKLGKKLLVMMDSLRYRFVVERKFDTTTKSHVYRFAEKPQQQQPTD
jgi:ABC-type dipeptide/oligopeptide/nickel transport system ATPase component